MSLHARETANKGLHSPYAWTFANATARASFTVTTGWPTTEAELTSDDLNKWALDLDTGNSYRLVSLGPTTWTAAAIAAGTGNVAGPGTSTDNAIARFSGTDGTLIQNSGVLIDDSNNITGAGTINSVSPTAHGTRHNPDGVDPITTASAIEITDSTNGGGSSNSVARANHVHAHGTRGGGTLHANATTSVAGFMSGTDKQKVDLISLASTRQFIFSTDGHSSNSEADQGTNNGHPSMIMRGVSPTTDPQVRWTVPFGLPGYTSGTGAVYLMFTTNVDGAADETVIWNWGWRYADINDSLDPPNDDYSTNGAFSHDVSSVVNDTLYQVQIDTISASEMAELAAADIAFFQLMRESQSNASDDYNQDVYVHAIYIEYTANFFQPGYVVT